MIYCIPSTLSSVHTMVLDWWDVPLPMKPIAQPAMPTQKETLVLCGPHSARKTAIQYPFLFPLIQYSALLTRALKGEDRRTERCRRWRWLLR